MGKNDARAQVGEPVVVPLPPAVVTAKAETLSDTRVDLRAEFVRLDAADQRRADVARDSAALAPTYSGLLARSYVLAAAEHCKGADSNANARAAARRLLRLALAHLET